MTCILKMAIGLFAIFIQMIEKFHQERLKKNKIVKMVKNTNET